MVLHDLGAEIFHIQHLQTISRLLLLQDPLQQAGGHPDEHLQLLPGEELELLDGGHGLALSKQHGA